MLWHEEGYQIASVGTHVYSPSEYDVQFEGFVLSPSPFPSYPPIRDWGRMGASWRVCDVRNILEEERSAAVRDWVEEQASIQWF